MLTAFPVSVQTKSTQCATCSWTTSARTPNPSLSWSTRQSHPCWWKISCRTPGLSLLCACHKVLPEVFGAWLSPALPLPLVGVWVWVCVCVCACVRACTCPHTHVYYRPGFLWFELLVITVIVFYLCSLHLPPPGYHSSVQHAVLCLYVKGSCFTNIFHYDYIQIASISSKYETNNKIFVHVLFFFFYNAQPIS